jgi:LacI family transcriptional regulator, repressor for deo operon, udp, cdd, tsx, nupC, and nupG
LAETKLVTIRELAKAAGVSIGTVSRALKNQPGLSAETRTAVLQVAQAMGYDLRKLRAGKPRRLVFFYDRSLVSLAENRFYSFVLQGAEGACRDAGVSLVLQSVGFGDDVSAQVRRHAADALLVVGFVEAAGMKAIRACELPLVVVDEYQSGVRCVNDDNLEGARLATRHLLAGGSLRPAMIVGPRSHHSVALRAKGFRRALFDAGRPMDPDYEVDLDISLPYEEGARAAMRELLALPNPPDAVFGYNDDMALWGMDVCVEHGLSVPQDIAFVGYDDIAAAARSRPPLTTVRVDKEALGRQAAQALIDGEVEPGETLLPVHLVIRGSTKG